MQNLAPDVFWCPRCGTIKVHHARNAPWLVGRTRQFVTKMRGMEATHTLGILESLGVLEAINRDKSDPEPKIELTTHPEALTAEQIKEGYMNPPDTYDTNERSH